MVFQIVADNRRPMKGHLTKFSNGIPLEIMDKPALIAYSRLLEDFVLRLYEGRNESRNSPLFTKSNDSRLKHIYPGLKFTHNAGSTSKTSYLKKQENKCKQCTSRRKWKKGDKMRQNFNLAQIKYISSR